MTVHERRPMHRPESRRRSRAVQAVCLLRESSDDPSIFPVSTNTCSQRSACATFYAPSASCDLDLRSLGGGDT